MKLKVTTSPIPMVLMPLSRIVGPPAQQALRTVNTLLGLLVHAVLVVCVLRPDTVSSQEQTLKNYLQESSSVLGLGFATLPPLSVVGVKGRPLSLPCRPISKQEGVLNITWTNSNRLVQDQRRYLLPNGTLHFEKVVRRDSGRYRCVVRNGTRGIVAPELELNIAEIGEWQFWAVNTTVLELGAVRLTCVLHSLPSAQLTWLRDGKPLPQDSRYYFPNPEVLQITNIAPQDSGIYRCRGYNELLEEESLSPKGRVIVVSQHDAGDKQPKPALLAVPTKEEAEVGTRAVLECLSDQTTDTTLVWSRIDGREIRQGGTVTEGLGTLVFPNVTRMDDGAYNCSVTGPQLAQPITQIIELVVVKAPTVNMLPHGSNTIKNGVDSHVIRINCSVTGHPTPDIQWFKDGRLLSYHGRLFMTSEINEDENYKIQRLAISNIMTSDSGVYQCIGVNSHGVASEALDLVVEHPKDMPGAPVDLRVGSITARTVNVAWRPPPNNGNFSMLGYIVNYGEQGSEEITHVTKNTSILIDKLRPYTFYKIYVRTFVIGLQNNYLLSDPSRIANMTTKASRPESTDSVELNLHSTGPSTLQITWNTEKIVKTHGPIIDQKLQWRELQRHQKSKGHPFYQKNGIHPDENEYVITKLIPDNYYEVRVLVSTSAGYPHNENEVIWEPVKMPKVPRSSNTLQPAIKLKVTNDTCILVQWSVAKFLRSTVSHYEIMYQKQQINDTAVDVNDAATTSVTYYNDKMKEELPHTNHCWLNSLNASTCYKVIVKVIYQNSSAYNASGSICTLPVTPMLHHSLKVEVNDVEITSLNSTTLLVKWRLRRHGEGPDFYTVRIAKTNQRASGVVHSTPADALLASTAVNVAPHFGEGQFLQSHGVDRRSRSERLLHQPQDSTGVMMHEGGIEHAVRRRSLIGEHEHEDNNVQYVRVTRRRVNVSGLEPLQEYEVTITAATTSDISQPSEAVRAVTMEGVPTAPLNISWQPKSTKEVCLTWQRPSHVNGKLIFYQLSYSHDHLVWNNKTIDSQATETMLQGLVSNTNYSVLLVGVTAAGEGDPVTTHVYIEAILKLDPQHPSTYLVVICVLSVLASLISLVILLHCCRLLRQHRTSSQPYQGVGSCRLVHANGNAGKGLTSGEECHQGANGLNLEDFSPMLTSLQPHSPSRHIDTKGDLTRDGSLRENNFRQPLDHLDDIDTEGDVTRKLLPIVLNSEDSSPQSLEDEEDQQILQHQHGLDRFSNQKQKHYLETVLNSEDSSTQSLEDEDLPTLKHQHELERCSNQKQNHYLETDTTKNSKTEMKAQQEQCNNVDITNSLTPGKTFIPSAKFSKLQSSGPRGTTMEDIRGDDGETIMLAAT